MGMLMQYDLATNFDEALIDFVISHDTKKQIKSVFGKLKSDITGGGRSSFLLPEIDMDSLKKYIKKCTDAGIEFNYLINPVSLHDTMIVPEKDAKFTAFIDELYGIGVRAFTVNSPLLCRYIKKKYSDVRITVGLYSYPTSIQMIQYWVNNGADEITLDHAFNRDIPLLRTALETFKNTDVKLRLIANNFCLHGCVSKIDHACNLGCSSSADNKMKSFIDYHLLNCVYSKIKNPATMLCSDWIRPEDVNLYTQLMEETGNSNLTLKLVERTRTTEFLERVAKAYLEESYDGNLLDLLNWSKLSEMSFAKNIPGLLGAPAGGPPAGMPAGGPPAGFGAPYKPEVFMKYTRSMKYPEICIDNKKLNGFTSGFFKMGDCRNKLCGANILPDDSDNPAVCYYCRNWANKAVTANEDDKKQWLANAEELLNIIESREIFAD